MHQGYIKLQIRDTKNPLFQKPLIWHYWQYCLLKANNKPKKIIWNKKEITIGKGSFVTSRKKASQETGLSEQNIQTAITTLINLKMIIKSAAEPTNNLICLTIYDYSRYQQGEK